METRPVTKTTSVETLYRKYSDRIFRFLHSRTGNREDAENLAQDVWMRILESETEVTEETAKSYLFTIAANLLNDYLRKLYVRFNCHEEVEREYTERVTVTPVQEYIAKEMARMETVRVECLPPKRRIIYKMSRYEEMAVGDIAEALSLSFRTVENHLRMGRRDVRNYISAIA